MPEPTVDPRPKCAATRLRLPRARRHEYCSDYCRKAPGNRTALRLACTLASAPMRPCRPRGVATGRSSRRRLIV